MENFDMGNSQLHRSYITMALMGKYSDMWKVIRAGRSLMDILYMMSVQYQMVGII